MNVYVMRHGETYWNKAGKIQGSSDIELTDFGVELARLSAEGFYKDGICFDRIYTSPLIRAETTAKIIAEKDLKPSEEKNFFIDARLKEMSFGNYEGIHLHDRGKYDENIVYCFSDPARYVPDENGETYEEVFARVDDFMDHEIRPLEEVPGIENVLVLCHGTVIRAILRRVDDVDLLHFWKMRQPNCSINLLELKDGEFTSIKENILYYDPEELTHHGIL